MLLLWLFSQLQLLWGAADPSSVMVWLECIQFLPGRVHAATLQFASCKFQSAALQAARLQFAGLQAAGVQVVVPMCVVMLVA